MKLNNDYELIKATKDNIDKIIEYKLNNIFEYAKDIDELEKNKITNYVCKDIKEEYNNFKMISVLGNIVGTVGVISIEEGSMIDEIFIEEEYRCHGIGTSIINNILNNSTTVYLWVYKNNEKAVKLYKRLGFIVLEETDTRFYMIKR